MGIATGIESYCNQALDTYVISASVRLASTIAPIAVTGVTIYIILMGLAIMRGEVQNSINHIVKQFLRITFIVSLSLSAAGYQNYVMAGIRGIQGVFAQAMSTSGGTSVGQVLDSMFDPLEKVFQMYMQRAFNSTIPSFYELLAMLAVVITEILIYAVGIGLYIVSLVGLSVCLAVGPAFILMSIWPATKQYTERWLSQTLSFALLNGLIIVVVTLFMNLISQYATEAGTATGRGHLAA